jgi:hypothetical protein
MIRFCSLLLLLITVLSTSELLARSIEHDSMHTHCFVENAPNFNKDCGRYSATLGNEFAQVSSCKQTCITQSDTCLKNCPSAGDVAGTGPKAFCVGRCTNAREECLKRCAAEE